MPKNSSSKRGGSPVSEAQLLPHLLLAVTACGGRAFRNQVGLYTLADGRRLASGLCVGSSDLVGWTKDGRFLAVEAKSARGRLTHEQQSFLTAVRHSGGITIVARCPQDVINVLQKPL